MKLQTQQYLSSKIFKDVEYEISAGRLIYEGDSRLICSAIRNLYFMSNVYEPIAADVCSGCKLKPASNCTLITNLFIKQCKRQYKHPELFL